MRCVTLDRQRKNLNQVSCALLYLVESLLFETPRSSEGEEKVLIFQPPPSIIQNQNQSQNCHRVRLEMKPILTSHLHSLTPLPPERIFTRMYENCEITSAKILIKAMKNHDA